MGSRLPRRTVGCSNFIANARQPQEGHELGLSLSCRTWKKSVLYLGYLLLKTDPFLEVRIVDDLFRSRSKSRI